MSNLVYSASFFLLTILILWRLQRLFLYLLSNHCGAQSIYISALIGTPIHELSHALMCIVFRHKINAIKLFSPDKHGTLGYVNHSYNTRNLWHVLGNLFIGIAPLIGGTISVYYLTLFVMPSGNQVIHLFSEHASVLKNAASFTDICHLVISFKRLLIFDMQKKPVPLLIWAYLSVAISLHLMPSKEDFKGAFVGFIYFLVVCMLLFGIKHLMHLDFAFFIGILQSVLDAFFMMLVLAIYLVLIFLLLFILIVYFLKMLSLPFRRLFN